MADTERVLLGKGGNAPKKGAGDGKNGNTKGEKKDSPGSENLSRRQRIVIVSGFCMIAGLILSALVLIIMGLMLPAAGLNEQLVLPSLILAFFIIMAVFAPVMPIWPIDVPDDQVWAIIDGNNHLLRYVGPGTYYIRPIQDTRVYSNQGVFSIDFDDESFLSRDLFPYRVRAHIVCRHDVFDADPTRLRGLLTMPGDSMQNMIKTRLDFVIREQLANYPWQGLNLYGLEMLREPLAAISESIQKVIDDFKPWGIALIPPINIFLDLPKIAADARQRRMATAALGTDVTGERNSFAELVRLTSLSGDTNFQIDDRGKIRLTLDPGKRTEVTVSQAILGALEAFNKSRPPAEPEKPSSSPPTAGLIPATSASSAGLDIRPAETPTDEHTPTPHGNATPHQAETYYPPNPISDPRSPKDDVIDAEEDEEGHFTVPPNPLF